MNQELESVRRKAENMRDERMRSEQAAAANLEKLVSTHLPEWLRIIKIAMGKKQTHLELDFEVRKHAHIENWASWIKPIDAPRIDLSSLDYLHKYCELLKQTLGDQFQVQVHYFDSNSESSHSWKNSISIFWAL